MGMTDSQFKAFVRFLIDAIKEASDEKDEVRQTEKIARILDNLQKALED